MGWVGVAMVSRNSATLPNRVTPRRVYALRASGTPAGTGLSAIRWRSAAPIEMMAMTGASAVRTMAGAQRGTAAGFSGGLPLSQRSRRCNGVGARSSKRLIFHCASEP